MDHLKKEMLAIKLFLLSSATAAGVMSLCRFIHRRDIRILAYHGIDWLYEPVINWDGLQVRPRVFRSHLEELRRHYHVVSLKQVVDALVHGDDLPFNAVAITFDDGYQNNLTLAAPFLQEFGFPATFFVSTGFIDGVSSPWWYRLREAIARTNQGFIVLSDGSPIRLETDQERMNAAITLEQQLLTKPAIEREDCLREIMRSCKAFDPHATYPLMNRNDIRRLAEMGFEIGAHTVTHISMGRENPKTIEQEIHNSLVYLREIIENPSNCYSYPHGALPQGYEGMFHLMRECGILAAVTTEDGMVAPGDDIFQMKRLSISGHRAPAFAALLSGFTGWMHKN